MKTKKVPWDKVPEDTKVLLGKDKVPRHFRNFSEGKYWFYEDGKTSWTGNWVTSCSKCVLGQDIEIDGVVYPTGSK